MPFVIRVLHDLIIELPVATVCAFVTWNMLWRLRSKGAWTVALGFVLMVGLTVLLAVAAPQVFLSHHSGMPPVLQGINLGCTLPMVFMVLFHWKKNPRR